MQKYLPTILFENNLFVLNANNSLKTNFIDLECKIGLYSHKSNSGFICYNDFSNRLKFIIIQGKLEASK